jgi:uncharacterized membrane protein YedE/YeeE
MTRMIRSAQGKSMLLALGAGALFGAGLAVSGMTQPAKVLGFLDVGGRWDASLMFVMLGAIGVHYWAYRLLPGRRSPWFAQHFGLPTRHDIDARLCLGAVLFGVGWGLGGYCPGPAFVALAAGGTGVRVFVAAMLFGMWMAQPLLGVKSTGAKQALLGEQAPFP